MTFDEFWAEAANLGLSTDESTKRMALAAWDAALCAASAQSFDRGKVRDGHAILAGISRLHSWVNPTDPS